MLRNPISYIFKLGKRESLPFRPLMKLSALDENPSPPPPSSRVLRTGPERNGPARHSNQMSS